MNKRKSIITIIFIILILLVLSFFIIIKINSHVLENKESLNDSNIKYVFLFIGDGMDENHIELTEIYNNSIVSNNPDTQKLLSFTSFPNIGLRKNYNFSSYIPDSASSGTAIASGILTNSRNVKY